MSESFGNNAEEDLKAIRHSREPSPILRWFDYHHLKPAQAGVTVLFGDLADKLDKELPAGPEKSVALRKLLEAKDAAVRASLEMLDQ